MTEEALTEIVSTRGITCSNPSYYLEDAMMQYELTVRAQDGTNFRRLAATLGEMEGVIQFSILPSAT